MSSIKIIPRGQVYRQLFDAEVQLVKDLEETKSRRNDIDRAFSDVRAVRNLNNHGILNERQKTWANAKSNDWHTENPVLVHHEELERPEKITRIDDEQETEVEALPDVVESSEINCRTRGIISKLEKSRVARHDTALEDLCNELSDVGSRYEPMVSIVCQQSFELLELQQEELDKILAQLQDDEVIAKFSFNEFYKLWGLIVNHCDCRHLEVNKLKSALAEIEESRKSEIFQILKKYAQILERIAHRLPPHVKTMMEKELQMHNLVLISNKKCYADLQGHLSKITSEQLKSYRDIWCHKLNDWRHMKQEVVISEFHDFMESDEIINTDQLNIIVKEFIQQQREFNQKRLQLCDELRQQLKPPHASKGLTNTWHNNMLHLARQIASNQEQYLTKLHREFEKICQKCMDKVDEYKQYLLANMICSPDEIQQLILKNFLNLVGEKQKIFEEELQQLDLSMEKQSQRQIDEMKSLFKFSQGLAYIWDQHEIGLANQERIMQENLDITRNKHDVLNQDREANLDILMDKMRQESTQQALKTLLKQVLDVLDKIKAGYEEFRVQQEKIVKKYPSMVQTEFDKYDSALCKYFCVAHKPTEKKSKSGNSKTDSSSKSAVPKSARAVDEKIQANESLKEDSPEKTKPQVRASPEDEKTRKKRELLLTAAGTSFYIIAVAGVDGIIEDEQSSDKAGRSTSASKNEDEKHPGLCSEVTFASQSTPYNDGVLDSFAFPPGYMNSVKKVLRQEFLQHLMQWKEESQERARSIVTAKGEELKNELQLRLHLHAPRAKRAELDIHNVRAAELVMHAERVDRHIKGVRQTLLDLRKQFYELSDDHDKLHEKFKSDIHALETIFGNASKSEKMHDLSIQLKKTKEKHMSDVRADLRAFRQKMDDTSQMLREANSKFIKSFRVFSDGGNFSVEEIEEYKSRLDKIGFTVEQTEAMIMADLENMESQRTEKASSACGKFEENDSRFKHHMADLVFIEKISRWLTNTQVKIKSEATESNTQSQTLSLILKKLNTKIDAIKNPHAEKESIQPIMLHEWLMSVFDTFRARAEYLDCMKLQQMSGLTTQTGRVGFADVVQIKKQQDESAVRILKNIMGVQKQKLQKHQKKLEHDGKTETKGQVVNDSKGLDDKSRTSISRRSTNLSDHSNGSRKVSTAQGSGIALANAQPVRRGSRGVKIDKKYLIFGDKPEEATHFLANVRRILQFTLEGMLILADGYYKTKGLRPITRPAAIQENFDSCAEMITNKLQSYMNQSEKFYNTSLKEFRNQIRSLEKNCIFVPSSILSKFLRERKESLLSLEAESEVFKQFQHFIQQRSINDSNLHTDLGHPSMSDRLDELCKQETERREECLKCIDQANTHLKDTVKMHAKQFIEDLVKISEQLFLQYDNLLILEDVNSGDVGFKLLSTEELARRKNNNLPLEVPGEEPVISRGRGNFEGLPLSQITCFSDKSGFMPNSPAISTMKNSSVHSAIFEIRNQVFKEYISAFESVCNKVVANHENQLLQEERWTNNWQKSVDSIINLHK